MWALLQLPGRPCCLPCVGTRFSPPRILVELASALPPFLFRGMALNAYGLLDQYTLGQQGIRDAVNKLQQVVKRVDPALHAHLQSHDVDYLQFTLRWMNCLLLRELPLPLSIRLWDTYFSEGPAFLNLHVYVCAALLWWYRNQIKEEQDSSSLMMFLIHLPSASLSPAEGVLSQGTCDGRTQGAQDMCESVDIGSRELAVVVGQPGL
eukprot:gene2267-3129_t